jgi:hypothetical protein
VPAPAEEVDQEPVVAATQTDADFERINAEKVKESIQRTVKRTGVSFKTLLRRVIHQLNRLASRLQKQE